MYLAVSAISCHGIARSSGPRSPGRLVEPATATATSLVSLAPRACAGAGLRASGAPQLGRAVVVRGRGGLGGAHGTPARSGRRRRRAGGPGGRAARRRGGGGCCPRGAPPLPPRAGPHFAL